MFHKMTGIALRLSGLFAVSIALFMPHATLAAIARSTTLSRQEAAGVTTFTTSFDRGTDTDHPYLVVSLVTVGTDDVISGVTYGGETMERLNDVNTGISRHLYLYGLASPPSGSNDIVVSFTSTSDISLVAVVYTGVSTTEPDAQSSGFLTGSTSFPLSVSTPTNGDWLFMSTQDTNGGSFAASGTYRIPLSNSSLGEQLSWDSDGSVGNSGSHALTALNFSSSNWAGILIALAPVTIPPPDILTVSEGGTGASSFTLNGVLLGNATSSIQATAAGSAYQVFRVPSDGGAPSFGALDLSQVAAIMGVLSPMNGGTGATSTFSLGSLIFATGGGIYGQNNANLFWDNTNLRLGVGTATPGSRLDVNGTAAAIHFKGTGSAPSINTGSCAGTGGSTSISGTDAAGTITLNTGTATPPSANCLTVTYVSAYGSAPHIVFSPSNVKAAELSGAKSVYASSTASTFTFAVGGTSLSNATTYKWDYQVVE